MSPWRDPGPLLPPFLLLFSQQMPTYQESVMQFSEIKREFMEIRNVRFNIARCATEQILRLWTKLRDAPFQWNLPVVLSHGAVYVVYSSNFLSLWTKSYGVIFQMKSLQYYFHMVLFIQYVVLTFEIVWKIL